MSEPLAHEQNVERSGDGRAQADWSWTDRIGRPARPGPNSKCPVHIWKEVPARGRPRKDQRNVRQFRCELCGETRRRVDT